MARLDIGLLGEPRFSFDGTPWRFSVPPKCLPLLAMLILRREPLARAAIAAALWPDDTEADARANLRRHLHQLVKSLPQIDGVEWLRSHQNTLEWNPDAPCSIDVREFLDLAASVDGAEKAVSLYAGDLLEPNFDDTIIAERERLRALHVELLSNLAVRARTERDYASARRYADAILQRDEWREDAVRLAMEVRYLSGDRSGALATFERFAGRLNEELHTEPMRETLALRDAIMAGAFTETTQVQPERSLATTPLFGRQGPLDELLDAWRSASRGQGSVVFVAGEAGIGKSRLVTELLSQTELQGGRAVVGRTSKPESIAYQPIVEALRRLVPFLPHTSDDRAWLSALLPLLPEISHLHDSGLHEATAGGEQPELRLKEAIVRMLSGCARVRPLAIVLEDLHLAQYATIDVLTSLTERIAGLPILLVVTYRIEEATAQSPVRMLRRHLARSSRARQLTLDRLSEQDISSLVASSGENEETARHVFEASKGNPLFAWQLLRAHSEHGGDRRSHARLDDALIARANAFDEKVRLVADVAATIGDTFTVEEVAEVGGWSEAAVASALEVLLAREFIIERSGTSFEYAFAHSLIGSTLYDAVPLQSRALRHRRTAEVLTQTRGEHGYAHGLIAAHWLRGGDVPRARASLIRAAEQLLSAHARPDARVYAQRALDLDPPARERFTALYLLIKSIDRTGASEGHAELLDALDALAEQLGVDQRLEALGARVEYYNQTGNREGATSSATALRSLALASNNTRWINQAALHAANFSLYTGEPVAGEEILRSLDPATLSPSQCNEYYRQLTQALFRQVRFDEARELLRTFRAHLTNHPSILGEYTYASAEMTGTWLMDDPVQMKVCAERVAHLAQIRGDILDEARARSNLAYVRHQLHETSAARIEYARTLELYERAGHRQNVLIASLNAAMIEFETGHIDRAETQWRAIARELDDLGFLSSTFAIGLAINLAEVALYRGDVNVARAEAQRAYDMANVSKETWIQVNAQAILGAAMCACGDVTLGLESLRESLEGSRSQSRAFIDYATMYVNALVDARDVATCEPAAQELLDAFEADPLDQQYPGRVAWTLARAASLRDDSVELDRLIAWGRELVETRMQAFDDPADREAYALMHPNNLLLSERACALA